MKDPSIHESWIYQSSHEDNDSASNQDVSEQNVKPDHDDNAAATLNIDGTDWACVFAWRATGGSSEDWAMEFEKTEGT